ncbi:PadR family transcriptional regulator [Streptomyces chilikensis]|uniref:PadR family transcriptional regulator n=1 Tax=Streptomyces chilikensis TaxID=1194079 RepID=A0ABV3EJF0_9ACTN
MEADPARPAWGLSICQETGLGSGTVYPILERLVSEGWATRTEETEEHPGRPKRFFYELTAEGHRAAQQAKQTRPRFFAARGLLEGGLA